MTRQTEVFARRMREERQNAGLSQTALAERLTAKVGRTIDPSAVARMEKHERGIRLDEAIAVAEELGMPLVALLRDRKAVDDEIDEVRRELDLAQWRASEAESAHRDAQDAVQALRDRITVLEDGRAT